MENNEKDSIWAILPETEKENYVEFHKNAYLEDLKHSEKNMLEFPRWSIISGYYAMHNITKLFLAKEFGIKINSPRIHEKTICAIEEFLKDATLKEKIIKMLKEAENIYFNAERLKEKAIPLLLKKGREERIKSQYYTEDYSKKPDTNSKKAAYFLETIVLPYIKIVEVLLK